MPFHDELALLLRPAGGGVPLVSAGLDEQRALQRRLVGLGDVLTVPQLLHDEMLSPEQLSRTRAALYPDLAPRERTALPVSPLSIAEEAVSRVVAVNPDAA